VKYSESPGLSGSPHGLQEGKARLARTMMARMRLIA